MGMGKQGIQAYQHPKTKTYTFFIGTHCEPCCYLLIYATTDVEPC